MPALPERAGFDVIRAMFSRIRLIRISHEDDQRSEDAEGDIQSVSDEKDDQHTEHRTRNGALNGDLQRWRVEMVGTTVCMTTARRNSKGQEEGCHEQPAINLPSGDVYEHRSVEDPSPEAQRCKQESDACDQGEGEDHRSRVRHPTHMASMTIAIP